MLNDFLKKLKPIIKEEMGDYKDLLAELLSKDCFVSLMPCVTFDLWPVYALQCSGGKDHIGSSNKNMVYIAPVREHDDYFKPYFETAVSEFYYNDNDTITLLYGAELDEMLLLASDDVNGCLALGSEYKGANVVYMGFTMPDGSKAFVFFVADKMLNTWINIFEKYSVVCDMIIESHKGMGDWFTATELYTYMQSEAKKELLPVYYFKGKYMSSEAPCGFKLIYSFENSGKNECVSRIYLTGYNSHSPRKIVFLDIDGVLNSAAYDRHKPETDGNIDITRLELLKTLIDRTDAGIVLTSSWRKHWEKNPADMDETGFELVETFRKAGLEIYGKTPFVGYLERAKEIKMWLDENKGVERFVIIDDAAFGWEELSEHLVQTNYRIGRGLEEEHIDKALQLLI